MLGSFRLVDRLIGNDIDRIDNFEHVAVYVVDKKHSFSPRQFANANILDQNINTILQRFCTFAANLYDKTSMIDINQFCDIVFGNQKLVITPQQIDAVTKSYAFLQHFSENKVIYGINTGFGPMAQYKISNDDRIKLQYNIIRSHSAGCGEKLPDLYVRAVLLARLSTFLTGYSGVHISTVNLLTEFLNHGIAPVIYEHGSVGASGDLVQLAHVALSLIGEGEVTHQGREMPTAEIFERLKINPLEPKIREGLALLNGTSAMTGIGLINLIYAKKLLNIAITASALMGEITESFDDYFSEELNNAKLHEGQRTVASQMRDILSQSPLIRKRAEHLYNSPDDKVNNNHTFKDKIQENYSLRCIPQILGPVFDQITATEKTLINELNSASDNPIIDAEHGSVYHGGNFHGDYISLEMDKLKIVVTRIAMLAERQMNYLFNDKINEGLVPPFGNLGTLGLNYGLQACQFTATSTTAECQTLSFPNYVHSIPCNNDNQDIVSMGTNSALITRRVIDNAFQVMAIHYMALMQAVRAKGFETKLSPQTCKIVEQLNQIFPKFVEDNTKYSEISKITDYLKNHYHSL